MNASFSSFVHSNFFLGQGSEFLQHFLHFRCEVEVICQCKEAPYITENCWGWEVPEGLEVLLHGEHAVVGDMKSCIVDFIFSKLELFSVQYYAIFPNNFQVVDCSFVHFGHVVGPQHCVVDLFHAVWYILYYVVVSPSIDVAAGAPTLWYHSVSISAPLGVEI